MKEILVILAAIFMLIMLLIFLNTPIYERQDYCVSKGGVYVRTHQGFVCIEAKIIK